MFTRTHTNTHTCTQDFFSGEHDGAVLQEDEVYFCGVSYSEENYMIPDSEEEYSAPLKRLDERVRILEKQQVELISVPVPEFSDSNAAEIVHDFVLVRSHTHTHVYWLNSHSA